MPPTPNSPKPAPTSATLTLDDLTAHLLWPHLLKSARLAFSPHRIILCAIAVIIIFLFDGLYSSASGNIGPLASLYALETTKLGNAASAASRLSGTGSADAAIHIAEMFTAVPLAVVRKSTGAVDWPQLIGLILLLPVALATMAIFGGAVSRSVAIEFARGKRHEWTHYLGFALSRKGSLIGALAGPVILGWIGCGFLVILGWFFVGIPYLNVLGAVAFPLLLLASVLVALLFGGYLLGLPLLIPGVTCDGADAFDAAQRAYSIVFGRTLRLAVYSLICIVAGVLGLLLVIGLVAMVLAIAGSVTGLNLDFFANAPIADNLPAHQRYTLNIINFWLSLLRVLSIGYAVSLFFTSSTILFLVMRRLHDGQDMAEIHQPVAPSPSAPPVAAPAATPSTAPQTPNG